MATTHALFKIGSGKTRNRTAQKPLEWKSGLSVIIPERGGIDLLTPCLEGLVQALLHVSEPNEVIVIVNGSPRESYTHLQVRYPTLKWVFFDQAKGFTKAVLHGMAVAQFGAIYLLNNDMVLDEQALAQVMAWRKPTIFAIASHIFFSDTTRRREETGWTSMPYEFGLPRPRHEVADSDHTRGTVWAGAGSALFHADTLRELFPDNICFDPFYWEDADLGVRAWRAGYDVVFCPASIVWHRHRATVERFYEGSEVSRIFERNRVQFLLRNPYPLQPLGQTLSHIVRLDPRSVAELSAPWSLLRLARARWRAFRSVGRDLSYESMWLKTYLSPKRPTLLMVSPFCIIPPRHGSATRCHNLARELAKSFEIVLLSDELDLYQPKTNAPGAFADAPYSKIHLVGGRGTEPPGKERCRIARIMSHSDTRLKTEMNRLIETYSPCAVLIEHMELGGLVQTKTRRTPTYILALHDVLLQPDDPSQLAADKFETDLIDRFDGWTVCSQEDAALLGGRQACIVPNGYNVSERLAYRPSNEACAKGQNILFVGPFRSRINFEGICEFLKIVYPTLLSAVPNISLSIVGGDGAHARVINNPLFQHPSINVIDTVNDLPQLVASCAVTICPLLEMRGSSLKVIESIAAGRVCVCTRVAARGWGDDNFRSLVVVPDVSSFVEPLVKLLTDESYRLECESADLERLGRYQWSTIGDSFATYIKRLVALKQQ